MGRAAARSEPARQTRVARYNDAASLEAAMDDGVAAVIVEPVMANMGVIPPRRGFLRSVARIARSHGALLIFDETVTGYRLGRGGAQGAYGVSPDITTLGKALGGGLPIAALGGRRDVMESLAPMGPVYEASTFAGNPVSVAAAIASVRELGQTSYPQLLRAIHSITHTLQRKRSSESFSIAGHLRTGLGMRTSQSYDLLTEAIHEGHSGGKDTPSSPSSPSSSQVKEKTPLALYGISPR